MEGDSSFCGGWVRQAAPGARRSSPSKGRIILLLRGVSASRRLAHPSPAKGGIILVLRGASVHGGRISISLEYQIQPPAHPI